MSLYLSRQLATKIVCSRFTGGFVSLSKVVGRKKFNCRMFSEDHRGSTTSTEHFDTSLLEFLVCPLSKKNLRYNQTTNELVNDELGIAYPIVGGIPNMIPQDARLIQKSPDAPPAES